MDLQSEHNLRIFYKGLMERLGPQVLDRISKKSQMFCDEIDKVQKDHLSRKNNFEGSKEGEERSPKSA